MSKRFEYSIQAIPTMYNGRKYRSRLEAKWAAFFDLLEWYHEYEPEDLGKWSPDFALTDLAVEVKPITEFDQSVADKMKTAIYTDGNQPSERYRHSLLLGTSPRLIREEDDYYGVIEYVFLGWLGSPWPDRTVSFRSVYETGRVWWDRAAIAWLPDMDEPNIRADIISIPKTTNSTWFRILRPSGSLYVQRGESRLPPPAFLYPARTMSLWATACNAVQWHPKTERV